MMKGIFGLNAPLFWEQSHPVIPLSGKAAIPKKWPAFINGPPRVEIREEWLTSHSEANIGYLTGSPLGPDHRSVVIDVDDDRLVRVTKAFLGHCPCAKVGKKGCSFFAKYPRGAKLKSTQIKDSAGHGKIDILAAGRQTVLPPSIHPETNTAYVWTQKSLLEIDPAELPVFSEAELRKLEIIIGSKHLAPLIEGVRTHDAGVGFAAQLVSLGYGKPEIENMFGAILPEHYNGDSLRELDGWIESAREKFGTAQTGSAYDPEDVGPIPLGRDGDQFHFRCQQTNRLASRSARDLSTTADLLSLSPIDFWLDRYPKIGAKGKVLGVDTLAACDALIQGCTKKGHLEASDIRGFGMWEENGQLIRNTGDAIIESDRYVYSYPTRRDVSRPSSLDMSVILEFFSQPNWTSNSSAQLLLGWCFSSIICGALPWRPHLAITGAAASGKSTQLRGVGHLLAPVAVILEGISTEAGIRQNIGYDARPCILDELEAESSGDIGRVNRIVKLMRSASSANGSVARGTQSGNAHNFCTRASFLIGAINARRIGAADTSRVVRLEMRAPNDPRAGRTRVLGLLDQIKNMGPAFCDLAMGHAREILDSIPILHAAMPAIQERQADNLATLLAGYWVATTGRTITSVEAESSVAEHILAIEQQQEATEESDAVECLNVLLAFELGDEARTPIGKALQNTLQFVDADFHLFDDELNKVGVRIRERGFLVATSHPALRKAFAGSRWEGGLWGSALERLPGAKPTPQCRFDGGVRSRAVWIPYDQVGLQEAERTSRNPVQY